MLPLKTNWEDRETSAGWYKHWSPFTLNKRKVQESEEYQVRLREDTHTAKYLCASLHLRQIPALLHCNDERPTSLTLHAA